MLVAIKGLGIGGAERLISEGARHWTRDRFEYHVAYGLPWKNQLVGELEALNVPVHLIGGTRGLGLSSLRNLRRTSREVGASIVHAHLPVMGVLARLASPAPVVYTEHNIAHSYRLPTKLANRLTYPLNRAVTVVSEQVAASIENYRGPTPVVIRNGVQCSVSDAEVAQTRVELGVDASRPLISHVGNIRPHKGHDTLIEAAVAIKAKHPDVLVVSIGAEKHRGDLERLRRKANEAGVADTMRFMGRRENPLPVIAASDVFVNPSDVEGLPLVVLEAMALGTPVVATSVGGVPSVIKDGETGLLVDPGDPRGLAEGVLNIFGHPEEAKARSIAATRLIEEAYSLEEMVRAHEALYKEILDV